MNRQTRLNTFTEDAIHSVKDTIDNNPLDRKTVTRFADHAGVGRNQLQKYFKHFFGAPINEYQKWKRMEAASGMLEEGRLTILQIAFKCGYSSPSSFARAFKEVYGIPPTQCKRREKLTVIDFIDEHEIYDNPHHVEIVTHFDDSVSVVSNWPGELSEGDIYIELFFESNTVAEFIEVFGIRSVDDLKNITPEFLLNLYQEGKAIVWCCMDTLTFYSLQFRKENDKIVATDDRYNEHETTEWLETPQQFMDYTQRHFLLHR